MNKKDQELFIEICMICLMQGGMGINTKSPQYIREKMGRKSDLRAIYASCGSMVKGRIKEYCTKWNLPFDKWERWVQDQDKISKKDSTHTWKKQMDESVKLTEDEKAAAADHAMTGE